jgi:prolyl-tRNA synthetase
VVRCIEVGHIFKLGRKYSEPLEARVQVVTIVDRGHQESVTVAETIAAALALAGVDILLDDRSARPGVKFADAELVGFPFRITVGPRGIADGRVELTRRVSNITEAVPIDDVVSLLCREPATQRSRPA